jgi:hypothetical protein
MAKYQIMTNAPVIRDASKPRPKKPVDAGVVKHVLGSVPVAKRERITLAKLKFMKEF